MFVLDDIFFSGSPSSSTLEVGGQNSAVEQPKQAEVEKKEVPITKPVAKPQIADKAEPPQKEKDVTDKIESPAAEAQPKPKPKEEPKEEPTKAVEEILYEKNVSPSQGGEPSQNSFLSYFIVLAILTVVGYLVFHNKKKVKLIPNPP